MDAGETTTCQSCSTEVPIDAVHRTDGTNPRMGQPVEIGECPECGSVLEVTVDVW
ncbi:MAG: hypothetical protein ABEI31_00520 [Halodesulfurarchaeum sp.]